MKFWTVAFTAAAAPTSVRAAGLLQLLDGLNDCLQYCLIDAAAKTKCSSIDDLGCICGSVFPVKAAACLSSYKGCKLNDFTDALKLQSEQCKDLAKWIPTLPPPFPQVTGPRPSLPPVPGLSKCASDCLNQNAIKWNCKDQQDYTCVCTYPFMITVTPCVLGCGVDDTRSVLKLRKELCSGPHPSSSTTPSPTEPPSSSAAPTSSSPLTLSSPPPTSASPEPSSPGPQPSSGGPIPSSASPEPSSAGPLPSSVGPDPSSVGPSRSSASPGGSSAGPGPTSPGPTPSISASATPSAGPSSSAGPASSQSPSPTSSGAPQPSSSSPILDLSKLSPCALQCIVGTLTKKGCKGPQDTGCLCQAGFTNDAAACLMQKCKNADVRAALALQRGLCPAVGLPDLGPLNDCTLTCVLKTLQKAGCAGPLDKNCLCKLSFTVNAGLCLAGSCLFKGFANALELNIDICRGNDHKTTLCQATGIWRLTDPRCWFVKRGAYGAAGEQLVRRGSPAAKRARLLEAK